MDKLITIQERIARKNAERKQQMQELEKHLQSQKKGNLWQQILKEDPADLLSKIKDKYYSSLDVLHAFQFKASYLSYIFTKAFIERTLVNNI